MKTPQKTHTYQNHHLDGPRWDGFEPRDDDIIISTSYKAGTTWMQTIIGNILFWEDGPPGRITEISQWLDFRLAPFEETLAALNAQTHRRFIKTHLPLDGLPYYENVKYIMVSRDPRDVFMSLINHYGNFAPDAIDFMNSLPDRVGDPFPPFPDDIHDLWAGWISKGWFDWEEDGYPYWSHMHHGKTWWDYRHMPNIELFHYSDMLADLEGQMRRAADYIGVEIPEARWPAVVNAAQFETVKNNPAKVVSESIESSFIGGGDTFINKGTNGRWKDVLTEKELTQYEAVMKRQPADYANWLQNGGAAG
jgi:aryl sulfotransferase